MLSQSKQGNKSSSSLAGPINQLKPTKNWFLVPQKNVFLWLSDKDFNEELRQLTKNCKPIANSRPEGPESIAEIKWKKHKSKNRIKMGEAISHLKDVKKNWYSLKEHTFRVMNREGIPWQETDGLYPSFQNRKDTFIQKYQILLDHQEMLEKRISGLPTGSKDLNLWFR